jgi:hypothetical protein
MKTKLAVLIIGLLLFAAALKVDAASAMRAAIDCGTLSGQGAVRIVIPGADAVYVVRINCPADQAQRKEPDA